MAILSWMGFLISLIGIFPLYKIFEPIINLLTNKSIKMDADISMYLVFFAVMMLVLMTILRLKNVAKKRQNIHFKIF